MFSYTSVQFSSFQSLSRVWLFVTPWTAACQASLSITNSQSLLRLFEQGKPQKNCLLEQERWEDINYRGKKWKHQLWCQLQASAVQFSCSVVSNSLQSPWTARISQPVRPKGNQSWIFIGRTDAEAETPILRPPDEKSWLTGKDLDAGKDWRREKKGMTEDKMDGWHHRLDGHEF